MIWRYSGEGRALLGIPARDLTAADALTPEQWAQVAASDLYQAAALPFSEPPARGSIDLADGVSDGEAHLAGRALRSRKKG